MISSSALAAPLALSLSTSGGIVESHTLGAARDDFQLTLRGAIAVGRRVAITLGADADLERLEFGARLGVMIRPFFASRFSPYLRSEVALIAATHFGDDWELSLGVGLFARLSHRIALFAEIDALGRVGAVKSLADHLSVGVAIVAPNFW